LKICTSIMSASASPISMSQSDYAKFGFVRDPEEDAPEVSACGLVHPTGLRIHLI
jgi:hypothetical protein